MRSGFLLLTIIFSLTIFALPGSAQPLENPPLDVPPFILDAGGIKLQVQPKNSWTINSVRYGEHTLSSEGSFYSLVIDLDSGKFVGSGHKEGGQEQVQRVEITADGKPIDLRAGGVRHAEKFVFTKTSKVATTTLTSVLRLDRERLECEQFLSVDEDLSIGKIYAFMFAWLPRTTQWMAQSISGQEREGTFGNASWELSSDVQWTSIFDPEAKTAMLTSFAPDSQSGEGVKHGYWNRPVYHKEYYQPVGRRILKKGEQFHWAMTLRVLPVTETDWKEKVREAAAKETIWQKKNP